MLFVRCLKIFRHSQLEVYFMSPSTDGEILPVSDAKSDFKMTMSNPPTNKWRVIACFMWAFALGYSDAVPGAILPTIEAYYNVNYAVVSCIWIGNACGFIFVATLSHKIQPWLGKRYSLVFSTSLSTLMYIITSTGTKFPVIVIGFFLGGIGGGIGVAQTNVFLARFENKSTLLLLHHGLYGIGATVSPLLATTAINHGLKWHLFYTTLVGLMGINIITFYFSFKNADVDLSKWDKDDTLQKEVEKDGDNTNNVEIVSVKNNIGSNQESDTKVMKLALKNKITWFLSLFILFYQGSEVALGGWIVTFLLNYRKGDPETVGYVASGFWGGLTIGRLILTKLLHKYIGIRRGVLLVSIISILLVTLTWIVPHVIADAILVSLAGIFIGPNYPLMVSFTTFDGLLPRKIQVISMTIMTAFGSSGGALFPFIVGLLNEAAGTFVVLPVFIALYVTMIFLWILLPNLERRQHQPCKEFSIWERLW